MTTLDEILEKIKSANNIVVLTHENPDGDAIGSSLALYQALKALNKDVEVIIPKYSRIFEVLPCISEARKEGTKRKI